MQKMTQKEIRHTNRVLRVLRNAKRDLFDLTLAASASNNFPKTTLKAYAEVSETLTRAEVRITARDASAV